MYKTTEFKTDRKITVDITTLQSMLGVGRATAAKIGEDAGAVLTIGRRRLYNVPKIEQYVDQLSQAE